MTQNFLRARNALLAFKEESEEGVESAPTPATDSVKIEGLSITKNAKRITTNEHTGSLDGEEDLIGGMTVGVSFNVILKGSGAAGVAPEFGGLLKACALAEVVTATAIPASAAAAGAGGSTTVAQLGSSAAGTAGLYTGMPILFTGGVVGDSVIQDYDASKNASLVDEMSAAIDDGVDYQIPANVLYVPASGAVPSLTFHIYRDGLRDVFVGNRGTVSVMWRTGDVCKLSFNFTGIFKERSDVAMPENVAFDASKKLIWKGGRMLIDRQAAACSSFDLDFSNTLTNPDNPNQGEGVDAAQVTGRKITGSVDPTLTLKQTRDAFGDFRSGTPRPLHARMGSVAGNRVAMTVPRARYVDNSDSEREGIMVEGLQYQALGKDDGAYLCFY